MRRVCHLIDSIHHFSLRQPLNGICTSSQYIDKKPLEYNNFILFKIFFIKCSDSFIVLGLWVLGLAVSNINESTLQTNESKTLFLMKVCHTIASRDSLGLAEIKTYAQKMQDAQVTKSLQMMKSLFIRTCI